MLTKNEAIIERYQKKLIELKSEIKKHRNDLQEEKDNRAMELEIAIRVWHSIEESYIRYKLETVISEINFLDSLDFNIKIND